MPHREFKSAHESGEEITFTVGDDPYVFHARPVIAGGWMIDLLAQETNSRAMRQSAAFLDKVLRPEDAEHFAKRLQGEEGTVFIAMEELEELMRWLVEVYSGRPTVSPSPSATGQSSPSETSTAS